LEFFYRFKWDELSVIYPREFSSLWQEESGLRSFTYKFLTMFNIVLVLLTYLYEKETTIGRMSTPAIRNLYLRLKGLDRLRKRILNGTSQEIVGEKQFEYILLVCIFNCCIRFISEIFTPFKRKEERKWG